VTEFLIYLFCLKPVLKKGGPPLMSLMSRLLTNEVFESCSLVASMAMAASMLRRAGAAAVLVARRGMMTTGTKDSKKFFTPYVCLPRAMKHNMSGGGLNARTQLLISCAKTGRAMPRSSLSGSLHTQRPHQASRSRYAFLPCSTPCSYAALCTRRFLSVVCYWMRSGCAFVLAFMRQLSPVARVVCRRKSMHCSGKLLPLRLPAAHHCQPHAHCFFARTLAHT
jgi:hypothetical protein